MRAVQLVRSWGIVERPLFWDFAILVGISVEYMILRKLLHVFAGKSLAEFLVVAVLAAAAWSLRRLRYADIPAFISIFIRAQGAVLLFQVAFDGINVSPGTPNLFTVQHDPLASLGILVGIVCGVAALFRPAFLLPLASYYMMFRIALGLRTGIEVVPTDYLSMVEGCTFGTLGVLTSAILAKPDLVRLPRPTGIEPLWNSLAKSSSTVLALVWAVMVGAHLRSYFYSAIAKFVAGGNEPLTWLRYNPTANSILIGLERGDNPLSRFPVVLQTLSDAITGGGIWVNAFVLGAQLFAPLGAFNKRILIALALVYDMFHIGVYLTLGALFFFWIIVNLVIVTTSAKLPGNRITWPMTAVMLLVIAFGGKAFYTNRLGWLDGPKLASPHFLAVTRDGREIEVPGPYFGLYAYNIAQGDLYLPEGSFPKRIGGNTKNLRDWRDSQRCGPMLNQVPNSVELPAVQRMVQSTDGFARRHTWFKNWNTYYLYPHHMVPNPVEFGAFNRLKMNDIKGYLYRIDSVCLSLRAGRLQRNVVHRWQTYIPADQ